MEVTNIADTINARISKIESLCAELDEAGTNKANAIADYELAFAVAMARIAMGKVNQIEGEQLPEARPATVLAKYAAGLCHKERANMEIATNAYKSLNVKIDTLMATLNAKQSIMRHMSKEVNM